MRSVALFCRGMALALLVAVGGCAPGEGTGMLALNITAEAAVPAGAANQVVLVFPGEADRIYTGAFPLAGNAPLVLEFPNLPAGQATITVRAVAADGCPVAEASKSITVEGGVKTSADIVLAKSSGACADAGPQMDSSVDTSSDQRIVDAPASETPQAETPRIDVAIDVPPAPTDATDTPMGAGGAGGSGGAGTGGSAGGGTTGSGGIATGGAPGSGGVTSSGGTTGADAGRDVGAGGATGGSGTGGSGTGGSGTGGSGTGGGGTGGSGTGGSGTGGSGTGGSGTGGSGTGGSSTCQHGLVTASQVVIMGESFYAIDPKYIEKRIEAKARTAGALGATETYRNVAVSGQNFAYIASTEWNNAKSSTVKVVIMDGGAVDCQSSACPTCPGNFETLLGNMATAGVQDVIYTRMPEPGSPPGSNATLKGNYDILFPKMEVVCAAATGVRCHWVDLRPVWVNGDTIDGAHPTQSGGDHVGDAIWAEMVKDCIAQ
jgi:hypothetical protein